MVTNLWHTQPLDKANNLPIIIPKSMDMRDLWAICYSVIKHYIHWTLKESKYAQRFYNQNHAKSSCQPLLQTKRQVAFKGTAVEFRRLPFPVLGRPSWPSPPAGRDMRRLPGRNDGGVPMITFQCHWFLHEKCGWGFSNGTMEFFGLLPSLRL